MKYVILLTLLTTVFYNTQAMEKKKEEEENKQPQQQTIYPFGDEPEIQTQEYQIAKNGINDLLMQTEEGQKALEYIKLKYLNPHQELTPTIKAILEKHGLLVNNTITKEMYTAVEEYKSTQTYFKQVKKSQKKQFKQHLSNLSAEKQATVLENTQQMLSFKKKIDEKKEK